jgi:hypothetical protein
MEVSQERGVAPETAGASSLFFPTASTTVAGNDVVASALDSKSPYLYI